MRPEGVKGPVPGTGTGGEPIDLELRGFGGANEVRGVPPSLRPKDGPGVGLEGAFDLRALLEVEEPAEVREPPGPAPSAPVGPRRRHLERVLRAFVDFNWRLSVHVDEAAARLGREAGWRAFPARLEELLRPGLTVIDLGSGRTPSIPPALKRRLGLHVVGVDISAEELAAAPPDGYDEVVRGDAQTFVRRRFADLVVSRALAEHLPDPAAMFRSTWASLKPGGETIHFVPNGNAPFARLNRVVPQAAKRRVLHALYPLSRGYQGFPAYYRGCTPRAIRALFRSLGFRDVALTPYFSSNYLVALLPAHAATVAWQLAMQGLGVEDGCESFIVRARK